MKNFQDWLDDQTYHSHLRVLSQIKRQTHSMKGSQPISRNGSCKGISNLGTPPHPQKLKRKHSNLQSTLKQKQIQRQNQFMISRILNVAPVISKDEQVYSYYKNQSILKKKSTNGKVNNNLRESKMKTFEKALESQYFKKTYQALVKIKFSSIPKVGEGKSSTFWLQVISDIEKVTSSHYDLSSIYTKQIVSPFKKRLGQGLVLLLHCSRGIDYVDLGEYHVDLHNQNEHQRTLVSVGDTRKMVFLEIEIEQLFDGQKQNKI